MSERTVTTTRDEAKLSDRLTFHAEAYDRERAQRYARREGFY